MWKFKANDTVLRCMSRVDLGIYTGSCQGERKDMPGSNGQAKNRSRVCSRKPRRRDGRLPIMCCIDEAEIV